MDFVPVMLNVSDRKIIVIGGGEAAYKKVRNLAEHCSNITIIASEFQESFSDFNAEKVKMHITNVNQLESYLKGDVIVIIATDDQTLNTDLSVMCNKLGIMYNRIDDNTSPFIFPASFELDGIIVSVSTLGKSPSFARYLKERLKDNVRVYSGALPVLQRLRKETRIQDFHKRSKYFWDLLQNDDFWERINSGKFDDAFDLGLRLSKE